MTTTTGKQPASALTQHPNKVLWEKGDFTRLAATMRNSGEKLVAQLGITPGLRILDVGCGDGTTAIPMARLKAIVTGVDIAKNLVQAGNYRALKEGLDNIGFQEGDAADLCNMPNQHFDLVLSVFGAMFASRPLEVAQALVRVTKPGGRIVMGNWIPGDPTLVARVLKMSSSYMPAPPPNFESPMLWGNESKVIERFASAGVTPDQVSFSKETYHFRFDGTPSEFANLFLTFYGPTMNALEAATAAGKGVDFRSDLEALFFSCNQSETLHQTIIPATYLMVTIQL